IANHAPALCSRTSPSCPSGLTIRSDGSAVIRTIAAPAEAAAVIAWFSSHHGGNATATTSAPGRTCSVSAATAIQLAISKLAAPSQSRQRDVERGVPCAITAKNSGRRLIAGEDRVPEFYGGISPVLKTGTGIGSIRLPVPVAR